MPYRILPLVSGEIYHIFNRSIAGIHIFHSDHDLQRALDTLDFYHFLDPGVRFSYFSRWKPEKRSSYLESLYSGKNIIDILSFSLMPNHIHFLLKQDIDGGISRFMKLFQESYAKFQNISLLRTGSMFQAMFKAVRIESEEQLIHVSRYIHLNPLTSHLLNDISQLQQYPWNSYVDYVSKPIHNFVDTTLVKGLFRSEKEFKEFTSNQVDYQRSLDIIKHLTIERHMPGM